MRLPISLPLNYMRIFCRFRDITIFENLRFFAIFTDTVSFEAVVKGFLWDLWYENLHRISRLPVVKTA